MSFNVGKNEMSAVLCYQLIDTSTRKNRKICQLHHFSIFFLSRICNYQKWNGFQFFVLNVFETIHGLDSGNSSSKTNSKSYLNVGVPEIQRNLQTGNFRVIPKTLNHKVRLNWAMKLKFSGNTNPPLSQE